MKTGVSEKYCLLKQARKKLKNIDVSVIIVNIYRHKAYMMTFSTAC
jgi:hypothetical protein